MSKSFKIKRKYMKKRIKRMKMKNEKDVVKLKCTYLFKEKSLVKSLHIINGTKMKKFKG